MDTSPAIFITEQGASRALGHVLDKPTVRAASVKRHMRRGEIQGWRITLRHLDGVQETLTNAAYEQLTGA